MNRDQRCSTDTGNKLRTTLVIPLFFLSLTRVLSAGAPEQHRQLAEHYAPVLYQETKSAVLDFITRFDYDGDWNGSNNWKNAYLYELSAHVYYAVIESTRHYFITYAFYHARDYTARPMEGFAPKTEHENDMEGCTLTIEKDATQWGKPILLETLAHDVFYKYSSPKGNEVHPGAFPLDGSVVFLKGDDDQHRSEPAIFIEGEGHGVKAASAQVSDPGYKFPGVVYRYARRGAEVPKNERDPDVSYELVSIEETLWARRFEVGKSLTYCCTDLYRTPRGKTVAIGSSFNGPIGGCAAKPPWGWDQANDGNIGKGDWFRDPLFSYSRQLSIDGFSGEYVYNPYLEIAPGNDVVPLVTCIDSTDNKNIKQAITSSLFGIGKVLLSDGLSSKQVGDKAKQLFLTNTVLLEWARKNDFERWEWDKNLAEKNRPSFITDNLVEELEIPLLKDFTFSSPKFNAPTRYFDSIVMKYRCSLEGAKAKVYWTYQDAPGFDDARSQSIELKASDKWVLGRIDLSQSPQWDRSKSIEQIKLEILSPSNEKLATIDPGKAPKQESLAQGQFAINYIIFDRNSFSDTFER